MSLKNSSLISDSNGTLSKGNIMCWIAFIALIVIAFLEILDTGASNVESVNETLKYIFTTTFVYSAYKKGSEAFKEIKIGKNGIETTKD